MSVDGGREHGNSYLCSKPRLRIQTQRLPRTRTMTRSCRSMAMGYHCTYAPSVHRKSDHLAIDVRHRAYRGLEKLHTPASPRVEPRSAEPGIEACLERRVLTQMLRPRLHLLKRIAHSSATGHAYAGTIEAICGVSSAREQRNGRARTDDGWVNTAHVQVPRPSRRAWRPRPASYGPPLTSAPTPRMAVAPPRRGQGDHSKSSHRS